MLRVLAVVWFCLLIYAPASAQNSKGDRPVSKRENRFKSPFKRGNQKGKASSNKRVKTKGKSQASSGGMFTPRRRAQGGDRVGKPVRPIVSNTPSNRQRAWRGNISGNRLRVSPPTEGRIRNTFSQRYANNSSSRPRSPQSVSNRAALSRLKRLQGPDPGKPGKKRIVVPRSASGSFIARRSSRAWQRFPQKKKSGDVANTRDISGRRLRTINYETPRPGISTPGFKAYYGRKRVGDRPYRGPAAGRHVTATRRGQRAWSGDITGRRIRGRNFFSKGRGVEGQPTIAGSATRPGRGDRVYRGTVPGRGARSASRSGETRPGKSPLPVRTPGIGANGIGGFKGNLRGRRPLKGGGSVSGRTWNNRNTPLPAKTPGIGANGIGRFQGNLKGRRPLRGGGSVSGRLWNNKGSAIPVRTPSPGAARAARYPGNVKKFQLSPGFNDQGEEFSGYTKARRPLKGGGSVSGKLWNNRGTAIPVRTPSNTAMRAGRYSGNLKGRKPLKGGGSVSGKLWNNKETPIPVRVPSGKSERDINFPGHMKRFSNQPGFSDQGEEFTGYVRLRRFKRNYLKNPNAAEEALKKQRPDKSTYAVDGLQIKVKQKPIGKKPHAAEGSLPGIKPTKEMVKASQYARGVKRDWRYIRNPSSAEGAQKVREPGKAFGKSTDYQGNIRLKRYDLFGKKNLHPDAQFVKTNKNNVAEERDLLTNFKLWWARLFRKNENLPDHLKDKGHKPRYDKGEQGLWNE